jgi:D-xylonolactonase
MLDAPKVLSSARCVWPAGASLGEGTCWSVRKQALYWVDILGRRLYRYLPQQDRREEWTFDALISAVAERASAAGLAVTLQRGLAFFDPDSGELQRGHEPEREPVGNRFNDGKCDAQGRFWAGSMDCDCKAPTGALYRFDRGGRGTLVLDAHFPVTNGPTWSRDGRTMYFTDTVNQQIHAFDFDQATGGLGGRREWLRFTATDGYPDGMTTDALGRVWIAHWGGACVSCHDPDNANELLRVPLPASHVTNIAFGGPQLTTLYITTARSGLSDSQLANEPQAGGLFAIDTDAVGLPAHQFAG